MTDEKLEPTGKVLRDTGKRLIPRFMSSIRNIFGGEEKSSVKGTFSPAGRKAADAFFAHKEATKGQPRPPLTPLQKRMQSGGA